MFICEDVPLALEDLESITDEELDSNVSQRHCPNVAASILEGVDESMLPDLGEDVQVSKRMRSALLSALEEELDMLDERSPAMEVLPIVMGTVTSWRWPRFLIDGSLETWATNTL